MACAVVRIRPKPASSVCVRQFPAIALATGDFNEDGRPDLATASYSNSSVTVLFGNNVDFHKAFVEFEEG